MRGKGGGSGVALLCSALLYSTLLYSSLPFSSLIYSTPLHSTLHYSATALQVGDYWAQYYKFELQHGTPESAAEVVRRAQEKEPRYGERWTRVSKDVKNAHQPVDVLLKKVVVDIDTLPPP